ncbi:hypothetical protein [Natronorubrum bangense]|uniref:Uncharacterized protein n=2 Tax=Natronorubrum bangense TaxID=61858 RepID=L9W3X0_9EURY|nr:hypothetical protein [Natronorubrum bangense]ELY44155.1 hypothetical protein C494_17213 [Natronorubrum bangense JCM 10635]QCC55649.1 hypothetical protein DV706_14945 [Natronorubrum bangense]
MKWRCTWCGKPHETNDPPCDDCGHNTFEKAVVREGDDEPTVSPAETVDTGTTYVWACPNCDREHVKNNPPCSRCGNPDLEKTEQTYDDVARDLETPSWLEVARPYAPVFVVFAVVAALFATGIVPLSIIPGIGAPSPPDAPGEGTEAAGIDLEVTEREVHERLEADRAADESRTYDDGLGAYAEYLNRALVAIEYDDANPEQVDVSDFGVDCQRDPIVGQAEPTLTLSDYDDEAALADAVADALQSSDSLGGADHTAEGIDIHVVDESVYVFYAAC